MGLFTGWRNRKNKKEEPKSSHTLPDFVRGIQHAVNTAALMYEQSVEGFLDRHLRQDGTPEIQVVKIPNSKYVLLAPTMTVSRPPDMILEEMEVKMCIRVDKTEVKAGHPAGDPEVTRSSFQVSLASGKSSEKSSSDIDIVMKFKRGDAPEGVSRIMEAFVNSIVPVDPPVNPIPAFEPDANPPTGETTTILKPKDGEQPASPAV
jgi:hypothetical protein